MLQASPSHDDHHHQHQHHLSRVCGHGHIKKFWLMQTQKETECEDESQSQSTRNADKCKSSPPSAIYQNPCFGYGEHCSDTRDSAVDNEDNLSALYPAINQYSIDSSAQSLPVSGDDGGDDNGIPLNLSNEGNRTESINYRFHSGDESIRKNVVFDDAKSMGATVVSSHGQSTVSQAPQDIEVRSKALPLIESNSEESLEACTLPGASPPHKKVESKTKALNHGDIMEEKCMEDIGVRSLSGITISPPSHRKLQSRNRGGLDCCTLFDEAKCMETSQERDLPSPKVCTLCGATKTPMWRSGPQGPKSLCNACGIRYKKYRAFSGPGCDASDLTSLNPTSPPPSKALATKKRKQNFGALLSAEHSQSHKKSKWHQEQLHQLVIKRGQADVLREIPSAWKVSSGPASLKKIYGCMPSRFKSLGPLEEHLTVKRVFAKDEEEAAVLLMDLSCGLAF